MRCIILAIAVSIATFCIGGCRRNDDFLTVDMREKHSSTCDVHLVEMQTSVVPLNFVLDGINEIMSVDLVEETLFPHANKDVLRVSWTLQGDATHAQIYFCPKCTEARSEWINEAATRTIEKDPERFRRTQHQPAP